MYGLGKCGGRKSGAAAINIDGLFATPTTYSHTSTHDSTNERPTLCPPHHHPKINRECDTETAVEAIRMLKDTCYKLDIHLMPNLPGSNLAMDRAMFERVLSDPALQADQWKVYPCEVTPWTVIKKWFDKGEYVPYPEVVLTARRSKLMNKVPHQRARHRFATDEFIRRHFRLTSL